VKAPKERTTYCTRCRRHTVHRVKLYKKGKESAFTHGHIHYERDRKGYGGQKYPKQRRTAKTTKKMIVKLECKECGYKTHQVLGRLKKLIIGK
jgi:large subunit ribosomal protein L44e